MFELIKSLICRTVPSEKEQTRCREASHRRIVAMLSHGNFDSYYTKSDIDCLRSKIDMMEF